MSLKIINEIEKIEIMNKKKIDKILIDRRINAENKWIAEECQIEWIN